MPNLAYKTILSGLIVVFLLFATNIAYAITWTKNTIDASTTMKDAHPIDLDEDGDMDVVAASSNSVGIVWYDNNGSESFTERTIDTSASGHYEVNVATIDADSDLDIIAIGYDGSGDWLSWFSNDGSESFTENSIKSAVSGGGYGLGTLDVGDVDGDGDNDIVSTNDGTVKWWDNDGSGSFTEKTVGTGGDSTTQSYANYISIVDLDEDLDKDIVLSDASNGLFWYDNNGSESFTKKTIGSQSDSYGHDVANLDGSNGLDVTLAANGSSFYTYINNGSESFTENEIDSGMDSAYDTLAQDFDEDGDVDVVFYENSGLEYFENNGSASFTKSTIDGSLPTNGGELVAADIDGDTDTDFVIVDGGADVFWYENDTAVGDMTNPTIDTLSPADGATGQSQTVNLVITFSEAVDAETGNITIYKSSTDTVAETIDVTSGLVTGSGTATITINPSTSLSSGPDYYVQIDATAFDDAAGNSFAGISDKTTWNFTMQGVAGDNTSSSGGGSSTSLEAPTMVITEGENGNITVDLNYHGSGADTIGLEYWGGSLSKDTLEFSDFSDKTTVSLSGFVCDTTYFFKSFSKNSSKIIYNGLSFKTNPCFGASEDTVNMVETPLDPSNINPSNTDDTTPNVNNDTGGGGGGSNPNLTRDLFSTLSGTDVQRLQQFLNQSGFIVSSSGAGSAGNETTYFGPATLAAVVSFQQTYDVPDTGYVGPLTRAKINEVAGTDVVPNNEDLGLDDVACPIFTTFHAKGERGTNVSLIQEFLQRFGFFDVQITGFYGDITEQAIIDFQNTYADEILTPWGLTTATGRWYQSTRHKANELMQCSEQCVVLDNGVSICD